MKRKLVVCVLRNHVGRGVYAKKPFKRHRLIGEMTGRIVESEQADPRYCVDLGSWGYLVPKAPFRFLNHSCDPNCLLVQWEGETKKDGSPRLWVEARRSILAGDELTIDYAWPADAKPLQCQCGAANCRGFIVDRKQLRAQRALLGQSAA